MEFARHDRRTIAVAAGLALVACAAPAARAAGEEPPSAGTTPKLLAGPLVFRLTTRADSNPRSALHGLAYATVMRFDRSPFGRKNQGDPDFVGQGDPFAGSYFIGDADASDPVYRLLPKTDDRWCVVAAVYSDDDPQSVRRLDRIRLGRRVAVSAQPAQANGYGGVIDGKRTYERRPRLRQAGGTLSSAHDQRALRTIGCEKR